MCSELIGEMSFTEFYCFLLTGETPTEQQSFFVNATLVTIAEGGWRETETALKASYGNCMGWSQMLCAMKAWIEHGINLREGMYK